MRFLRKMFRRPKWSVITPFGQVRIDVREFFLDTHIDDPLTIAEHFGATPVSVEVARKEEEASDERLDEVAYLVPLIHGYASIYAEAVSLRMAAAKSLHEAKQGTTPTPEMRQLMSALHEATMAMIEEAVSQSITGAISQMVDQGLIKTVKQRKER